MPPSLLAYGWEDYTPALPDAEILRPLLALNLARSRAGNRGGGRVKQGPRIPSGLQQKRPSWTRTRFWCIQADAATAFPISAMVACVQRSL